MLRFLRKQIPSSCFISSATTRFFSHQSVNPTWNKLSEADRIEYALATSKPENAEVAFYRARGFKALGSGYANEAITAFEIAAKMDPKYSLTSKMAIAFLYESIGQFAEACKYFHKACQQVIQINSNKNTRESLINQDVMNTTGLLTEETQEENSPEIRLRS